MEDFGLDFDVALVALITGDLVEGDPADCELRGELRGEFPGEFASLGLHDVCISLSFLVTDLFS